MPARRISPVLELKPGDPVLISGGARGITALATAELARLWRPTLLIVGTTPLPDEAESADTRSLTVEAEIKAALHARLRHQGKPEARPRSRPHIRPWPHPGGAENLENLRQTGATVAYAEADVRDPAALARVLDGWRPPRRSRRLDPRGRPDQGQAHPPEVGRILRSRARDQARWC